MNYLKAPIMLEGNKLDEKKALSSGVSVIGDINIGAVTGQLAIGEKIAQSQYRCVPNIQELQSNLLIFKKFLDELNLPTEDKEIINGNISAAIRETKKDKPDILKIKQFFENAIDILKETSETVTSISGLYPLAKAIAGFIGLNI